MLFYGFGVGSVNFAEVVDESLDELLLLLKGLHVFFGWPQSSDAPNGRLDGLPGHEPRVAAHPAVFVFTKAGV